MCFGSAPKSTPPNSRPVEYSPPTKSSPSPPPATTSKMPSNPNDNYAPPPGPPPSHGYTAPDGPPPARFASNNPYAARPAGGDESFAPPPGPPPSQSQSYAAPEGPPPSHGQFAPPDGPPPSHNQYAAPSGPPPSHDQYAPPSGPPPSHGQYAAPDGPPPSHAQRDAPAGPPPSESYAPPPGPPPFYSESDASSSPKHDWQTAVPDTSLLPPPPSLGNQQSATNNATEREAIAGEDWCAANPLLPPFHYPTTALHALSTGQIGVVTPRTFAGTLTRPQPGLWVGKTKSHSPDTTITSTLPLYTVAAHSPLTTGSSKTIYYEVRIARDNRSEVSLAIGFTAPPYPTFRLPGWHRGSLAVHGDDGSRFINDRWGGKDFTTPFKPGDVLGLGMTFTARNIDAPPAYGSQPQTANKLINTEIFFTRNGQRAGGWDLHEEGDAEEDLPVEGLEGYHDLFAAVGTFEGVSFEIVFDEGRWAYHP